MGSAKHAGRRFIIHYRKGTNFCGVLNFAVFADRTSSTKFNPGLHLCTWPWSVCAFVYSSYMSSGDDDDLDRILERPVSDELVIVAMTELPQQPDCLQNLLGVLPASTNDAGSTVELPPRESRTGELRGGGPCQEPCLSLTDVLPWSHPCIVSYVKKHWHPLYIPAKIKHCPHFSQNAKI